MSLLASQLANLIGSENVRSDAVSLEAYSHDATPLFHGLPEVIVTPRSSEEVAKHEVTNLKLDTEIGKYDLMFVPGLGSRNVSTIDGNLELPYPRS